MTDFDYISDEEMDRLERLVYDEEMDYTECEKCGYSTVIEPDGDYPCPECGEGRITSTLMKYGLI